MRSPLQRHILAHQLVHFGISFPHVLQMLLWRQRRTTTAHGIHRITGAGRPTRRSGRWPTSLRAGAFSGRWSVAARWRAIVFSARRRSISIPARRLAGPIATRRRGRVAFLNAARRFLFLPFIIVIAPANTGERDGDDPDA